MHVQRIRRRSVVVASFLAGALALAGCGGGGGGGEQTGQSEELATGGILPYAADQEADSLQVNTAAGNSFAGRTVTIQVLPQLFNQSREYEPVLGAAFASAELTSENPQTVVVKIKPEANWSDGTPISADDFVYQWEHMNGSNPDFDSATTTGYENIESITGTDNGKTVTILFDTPFADWRSLFTDLMPAHVLEAEEGGWNEGFQDTIPVSGGPYMVESHTRGQELVLTRNEQFWGTKPKLDKIVFRFLPESVTQPAALRNREADLIYPQPQLDMVSEIKAQPDLQTEITFGMTFEHLTFNFENPHLGQLPVRQAIAKALNRDEVVQRTVAQFDAKAARLDNRIFLSGQPQYVANGAEYHQRDVPGAETLLQGAGYAKGADGIYAKDGQKLSLRLGTTAGNALRESSQVLIQNQLKEAGIDVQIVNFPADEWFGVKLPGGDFDIALFAWVGSIYPASSSKATYATGSDSNYGKYTNPQVDSLFDQANSALDPAQTAQFANQADALIWQDMATIPLYQKPTFLAFRNTYGGIRDNATNDSPFNESFNWGVKAAAQ